MNPSLYIGTSGWSYSSWRAGFYAGVRQSDWLLHCAEHFTALEVNATFYRHLAPGTFERWQHDTPASFRFALKGHRYITHQKRLRVTTENIDKEREHAEPLGEKLAVMLWQMPSSLACDMDRLALFIEALNGWPQVRHALEFRHASWFNGEVAACLAQHKMAVCQSDAKDWPLWDAVTTDLVYVRLHGHSRTYFSNYYEAALASWAERARQWLQEGRNVHVYFDNTDAGHAPFNAQRLIEMLARN
jgi:uncharacterized protein YecE (DUF72 family)